MTDRIQMFNFHENHFYMELFIDGWSWITKTGGKERENERQMEKETDSRERKGIAMIIHKKHSYLLLGKYFSHLNKIIVLIDMHIIMSLSPYFLLCFV